MNLVIYTDVDQTFVDAHYSFQESRPALRRAQKRGVPIVFVTSRTGVQVVELRRQTQVGGPFSSENGGGVHVPRGYFDFDAKGAPGPVSLPVPGESQLDGYDDMALGVPYLELVDTLHGIREELGLRHRLVGFADLDAVELARECGLSLAEAERAKQRRWDEVFRIDPPDRSALARVIDRIARAGLRCSSSGRWWHIHGQTDKGAAVRTLDSLFERKLGPVRTVGIGDAPNDIPLLLAVDIPFLVQRPDGTWDPEVLEAVPGVRAIPEIGPRGWSLAVSAVLEDNA